MTETAIKNERRTIDTLGHRASQQDWEIECIRPTHMAPGFAFEEADVDRRPEQDVEDDEGRRRWMK